LELKPRSGLSSCIEETPGRRDQVAGARPSRRHLRPADEVPVVATTVPAESPPRGAALRARHFAPPPPKRIARGPIRRPPADRVHRMRESVRSRPACSPPRRRRGPARKQRRNSLDNDGAMRPAGSCGARSCQIGRVTIGVQFFVLLMETGVDHAGYADAARARGRLLGSLLQHLRVTVVLSASRTQNGPRHLANLGDPSDD